MKTALLLLMLSGHPPATYVHKAMCQTSCTQCDPATHNGYCPPQQCTTTCY